MARSFTQDEPVKNTCPLIDAIIKDASDQYDQLSDVLYHLQEAIHPDLRKQLEEVQNFLDNVKGRYSELEPIREANSTLREWGNYWVQQYNNLEYDNRQLQAQLDDARQQLSSS